MILRRVPDQIGRYQILSELGRGSMGDVYLALDPNIERRIALKVLLPLLKVGVKEQAELRQRFLVEARAAGKLKHPGVVTLFDADTDPDTGLSFIAMEWVDGPSLHDVVRESGTLAIPRAVEIFEQVAHALEAAHQADLVHRDIKPANILLTATDEAKVTDFGIAKLASMSITATGWVPGSPFYMSPEQVRGQDIDGRSDVYSLGVSLYQCLTGEVPFQSDSLAGVTYMILEVDPRPPQPLNPDISDQLAAVMGRAMEKAPKDRFQSALEFAEALRRVSSEPRWAPGASAHSMKTSVPTHRTGTVTARERTATVRLQAADPEAPSAAAAHYSEPAPPSSRPVSRLTRYALAAIGLLLLFLVGPALRTSASQDQQAATLLVEATEPFSYAHPQPVDPLDPQRPALDVPVEPPPFTGAEEAAQADNQPEPQRAPTRRSLERAAPKPATVPAPASLPPAPAEPAPVELAKPVQAPAVRRANLEIVFKNRLKNAEVSVWIDEEKIWSRAVAAPKSVFKRVVGRNVFTLIPVAEGSHVIDVRVIGVEGKVDVVRRAEAEFVAGETKRLKVAMVPPKKLKLSWGKQNSG
ncbi:MAG: protein kinase [bacterium]|nr:protein kinase [bacterium]